jgi:hypothetical protein
VGRLDSPSVPVRTRLALAVHQKTVNPVRQAKLFNYDNIACGIWSPPDHLTRSQVKRNESCVRDGRHEGQSRRFRPLRLNRRAANGRRQHFEEPRHFVTAVGTVTMTWALIVATVILVGTLISLEAGYRWGRRATLRNPQAHEGIGALEASAFALLGLLLAFSFAGATSRLEVKRDVIVAEANAIGTAYRRVDLLPPGAQPPIRQQFKRLIEARISAYHNRFDPASAARHSKVFNEALDEIWSLAVAASSSSREMAVLVLPPINEMMDIATARAVVLQAHSPALILGLLAGAAISSGLLAGYGLAKRGERSWFHGVAYAAVLALTAYTVIDLDHPRFGLINIDPAYQSLVELRETIK